MKLVLNTAIDPHFCAIFSEENEPINDFFWDNCSHDGKNIYDFLSSYDLSEISFCGGITGPGGFASLRASAGILTSISIANNINIHQISAEKLMLNILGHNDFLLNSFGDSVWNLLDGRVSRNSIEEIDLSKRWFAGLLPLKKRDRVPLQLNCSLKGIEMELLKMLLNEAPQEYFPPHYEVAPV